ncbi:hypothetical protein C1645_809305 [Glomus cerebriforme]|uniref:Uncharacterized protein n=1 Tax=Glomus cerebriforme TaxID=658196 RepID=A0A397SCN8_9GLOM|nr:hypothetical protein C1645_809305 [Glomus cerebriforme]
MRDYYSNSAVTLVAIQTDIEKDLLDEWRKSFADTSVGVRSIVVKKNEIDPLIHVKEEVDKAHELFDYFKKEVKTKDFVDLPEYSELTDNKYDEKKVPTALRFIDGSEQVITILEDEDTKDIAQLESKFNKLFPNTSAGDNNSLEEKVYPTIRLKVNDELQVVKLDELNSLLNIKNGNRLIIPASAEKEKRMAILVTKGEDNLYHRKGLLIIDGLKENSAQQTFIIGGENDQKVREIPMEEDN